MKPEDIRSGRWRDPTGKEYDFADHTPEEYRAHCLALLAKGFVPVDGWYPTEIVTLAYLFEDPEDGPEDDPDLAALMARATADGVHTRDTIDLSDPE